MATKPNDGGSAFPRAAFWNQDGPIEIDSEPVDGMSLLDWFAGQAMKELIRLYPGQLPGEQIGTESYYYAAAMLAARKAFMGENEPKGETADGK